MAGLTVPDTAARDAFEAMAPVYDDFTAHHRYEPWTRDIERVAREAGLRGRRLLDVACGTGKSFLPFLGRGYEVVAVDVSPRMAALAQEKAAGRARVEVHDMRTLPPLGEFDLVCCLDDAVNYLDGEHDLVSALAGMRANLAAGGVLVFDANTLLAYRGFFGRTTVVQRDGRVLVWRGATPRDAPPGVRAEAELCALERGDDGWWIETRSRHRQRHHPEEVVRRALHAAGFGWVRRYGMQTEGVLTDTFDERSNSKALYVARTGAPET